MSAKEDRSAAGVPMGKDARAEAAAASAAADSSAAAAAANSGEATPFVRPVEAYNSWKNNLPLLYDCFIYSNLEWPSYACAWGPVLPELVSSSSSSSSSSSAPPSSSAASAAAGSPCLTDTALTPRLYPTSYVTQTFFLSRSTNSKLERDKWIGLPNMLLKTEVYYPNWYKAQDIKRMQNFDEDERNPCMVIKKKIVHPGEINRLKIVPQYPDLVATHTDSPLVYIWNTHTQPNRRSQLNTDPSVPDLTLQGHEEQENRDTLYYALDCAKQNPFIISGGSDHKICLWNIADYCSTLLTTAHVEARATAARGGGAHASGTSSGNIWAPRAPLPSPSKKLVERMLSPRLIFTGHTAQVEEVCFHPHHQDLLCSVGGDQRLMIWDMRLGGALPAINLHTGHTDDVNAVHWNALNDNLLLTGSSDHSVKLLDLRRAAKANSFTQQYRTNPSALRAQCAGKGDAVSDAVVHTFLGHSDNVTTVQWHSNGEYFASGSDDGDLCVWSIRGLEGLQQSSFAPASSSAAAAAASSSAMSNDESVVAPSSGGSSTSGGALPPKSLWDGSVDGGPAHLLFRHSGHRTAVVSFAWNDFVKDGWTIASLSDDSADATLVGGGRLNVWRVTDLLHKDYNLTQAEFSAAAGSPAAAAVAAPAAAAAAASTSSTAAPAASPTPPSVSGEVTPPSPDEADQQLQEDNADADAAMPSLDMPPPDSVDDALDIATPMILDE